MDWDKYTVFSVLSGVCLIGAAFIPDNKATERLGAAVGGLAFIGYAWYAGHAISGAFYFPIWIFIMPFAALLYMGASLVERLSKATAVEATPAPHSDDRNR
ncbi:MAG: hypothetical protein IPJ14_14920 [Kineosporiaceae bacterium]|nr:hypothetical protein [Kineosporiaceae bacterium]MBK7623910.1 hypothetical protein [Kineosporiaceae bacterium]